MTLFEITNENEFQDYVYAETYGKHPDQFGIKEDFEKAEQYVIDHATEEELDHLESMGII